LRLKENHRREIIGYVEKINMFAFFGRPSVIIDTMLIFLDEIDEHTVMPESMKSQVIGSDGRRTGIGLKKRILVLERDNYTCQGCGKRGGDLEAHHILPFSKYPQLRLALNNGMTLCKKCHNLIHSKIKIK